MQSIFPDIINSAVFQSLIDIDFYGFINREKITFLGKKVDKIILKFRDIVLMLNNGELNDTSYFIESIYKEDMNKFINDLKNEKDKLKMFENHVLYSLIINLLGELLFSRNFKVKNISSIEDILLCISDYSDSIIDKKEKEYFKSAVCEIRNFEKLLLKKKVYYDEARKIYEVPLDSFSSFLSKMIRKNIHLF